MKISLGATLLAFSFLSAAGAPAAFSAGTAHLLVDANPGPPDLTRNLGYNPPAQLTELAPGVTLAVADAEPADALAAQDCDLVVVGSRGLHGLKSLGSVSERVAHRADSSVLVVRSKSG